MRLIRALVRIVAAVSLVPALHAQQVQGIQCTLHRAARDSLYVGTCTRKDTTIIELNLAPPRDTLGFWRGHGVLRGEPWNYPMFLESRQAGGTFGQFRGWREVRSVQVDSQTLRFAYSRNEESPLRPWDLVILRRARALLADSAAWNRQDTRDSTRPNNCIPPVTPRTLFCALHDASTEVLGDYYGGPGIGEAFEAVFRVRQNDRHPLQALNNDPRTTITVIHAVLDDAIGHVAAGLQAQVPR